MSSYEWSIDPTVGWGVCRFLTQEVKVGAALGIVPQHFICKIKQSLIKTLRKNFILIFIRDLEKLLKALEHFIIFSLINMITSIVHLYTVFPSSSSVIRFS